jgi:hypothetical protein
MYLSSVSILFFLRLLSSYTNDGVTKSNIQTNLKWRSNLWSSVTYIHYLSNAGANPLIVSYNASVVKIHNTSVVKIHNAISSLARFENKNISYYSEKRSSLLQRQRCSCSCKFKSRKIGS